MEDNSVGRKLAVQTLTDTITQVVWHTTDRKNHRRCGMWCPKFRQAYNIPEPKPHDPTTTLTFIGAVPVRDMLSHTRHASVEPNVRDLDAMRNIPPPSAVHLRESAVQLRESAVPLRSDIAPLRSDIALVQVTTIGGAEFFPTPLTTPLITESSLIIKSSESETCLSIVSHSVATAVSNSSSSHETSVYPVTAAQHDNAEVTMDEPEVTIDEEPEVTMDELRVMFEDMRECDLVLQVLWNAYRLSTLSLSLCHSLSLSLSLSIIEHRLSLYEGTL